MKVVKQRLLDTIVYNASYMHSRCIIVCTCAFTTTLKNVGLWIRYGTLYTAKNVAISGTHSHSGPGGYLQYVLYIVTSKGFVRQSFDALADGIELAIVQAHENLRPGSISFNEGTDQCWTGI